MPDNKTKNTCFASGYMEEMIMCGIVGYIGEEQAAPILLEGLEKLEYRGYDSAGVAVVSSDGRLQVEKSKGRLTALRKLLASQAPLSGCVGIGHTRWPGANSFQHITIMLKF